MTYQFFLGHVSIATKEVLKSHRFTLFTVFGMDIKQETTKRSGPNSVFVEAGFQALEARLDVLQMG